MIFLIVSRKILLRRSTPVKIGTNPGVMRYGFLINPISGVFASIFFWRGSKVLEKFRE